MYIQNNKDGEIMGDLKKKKPKDYITRGDIVDTGEGKIIIKHSNASSSEQVIEQLRGYIQKFYEIQEEKMEQEEQSKKNEGE